MLIGCKIGCKKQSTTTIKLDLDKNEALCEECGEVIPVSVFTKNSLKLQNKVYKKAKDSLAYKCDTCNLVVPVNIVDGKVVGKNCSKDCNFNLSVFTKNAIELILKNREEDND